MKKLALTFICVLLQVLAFAQPANDLCGGAIVHPMGGGCVNGTNVAANDDIVGEAGCATPGPAGQHLDVWYSFVATGTTFTFTLSGGTLPSGELILASSTGPCAGLAVAASSCGALPLTNTFTGLVPGTTYYIIISAPSNGTGTFTLCADNPVVPPTGNQDCSGATQVCSNSPFSGNSSGFGVQELNASNQGCLFGENQSSWYVIQIQTSGTLEMTIAPTPGVDYDYALWGPNPACPPTTAPLRCSFASGFTTNFQTGSYNTGIGPTGTEPSDGTGGTLDGWSSTINVIAGEIYILLIDNFSSDNTPFNLNWGGTAGLNCSPLPIELLYFTAEMDHRCVDLKWASASEINNDFYIVERSINGVDWEKVSTIKGSGNSSIQIIYSIKDCSPKLGVSYYRLSQTDYNGTIEHFNIVSVNYDKVFPSVIKIIDLMGKEYTDMSTSGFYIVYYSDGTYRKFVVN